MCDFGIDRAEIADRFGDQADQLDSLFDAADRAFPGILSITAEGLFIPPDARALTRMIARSFDAYDVNAHGHSSAI